MPILSIVSSQPSIPSADCDPGDAIFEELPSKVSILNHNLVKFWFICIVEQEIYWNSGTGSKNHS